jgi:SAM-dependent methyltransferase
MADMMDIYKRYAVNYDELVMAEDYQGNLSAFMLDEFNWDGKTVYEAGIGTGRVTSIFIDRVDMCYGFDREQHMLDRCRRNLSKFSDRLCLAPCDNTDLTIPPVKADTFIQGWSFGHVMVDNAAQFQKIFHIIHEKINEILKPDGTIILIETMGTNVSEPGAPLPVLSDFYGLLENEYHFSRKVLDTSYRFNDVTEAARIMGFFFGEQMAENILKCASSNNTANCNLSGNNHLSKVIPEFTGIWYKTLKS